MKSIALLILLVGIIFVVIGYTKSTNICPPPKIEYRFVPKTFYEEQLAPDDISGQFKKMFTAKGLYSVDSDEDDKEQISENTNDNFFYTV
tara:strand:+ start:373 stop:642 length:270 start_codon:yes stop_codon:yes gene_type:complete